MVSGSVVVACANADVAQQKTIAAPTMVLGSFRPLRIMSSSLPAAGTLTGVSHSYRLRPHAAGRDVSIVRTSDTAIRTSRCRVQANGGRLHRSFAGHQTSRSPSERPKRH